MRRVQLVAVFVLTVFIGASATGCATGEQQDAETPRAPGVSAAECSGYRALAQDQEDCAAALEGQPLVPLLSEREADVGASFECFTYPDEASLKPCATVSTGESEVRVAIVGDSHAATLAPSLTTVAQERDWGVQTIVSNGCVWTNAASSERCDQRLAEQEEILLGGEAFDIVIVSSVADDTVAPGTQQIINERFDQLVGAGSTVVVVQDNPYLNDETDACLETADADQVIEGLCDFDETDAYPFDDQYWLAAQQRDDVVSISTTDLFCKARVCPVEIGGLVVYRDGHHLTATYAESIAEELLNRIESTATPDV